MKKFNLDKHCQRDKDNIPVKKINCNDGFMFSVQAGINNHCTPSRFKGPWTHFEVGFPNEIEPAILDYIEDPDYPCGTVYLRVPKEVVYAVIKYHGGVRKATIEEIAKENLRRKKDSAELDKKMKKFMEKLNNQKTMRKISNKLHNIIKIIKSYK